MNLVIQPVLWESLGLDDDRRYWLTMCCFYVGKGVEETRELLSRNPSDPDVLFTEYVATLSGLSRTRDSMKKGR